MASEKSIATAVSGASLAAFVGFLLTWPAMVIGGALPDEGFWAILREPVGKLGLLAVAVWLAIRTPERLKFGRVGGRTLGVAVLCGLLNLPISQALTSVMLIPLTWLGAHFDPSVPYDAMLTPAGALFGVLCVLFGVVVEEILFRGCLLWGLESLGPRVAVGLSAALFAASHMTFLLFPWGLILGLYTGMLVKRTGSIWPAIVAHGVGNTAAILTQSWPELNSWLVERTTGAGPNPEGWLAGALLVAGLGLMALWSLVRLVAPPFQRSVTASREVVGGAILRTPVLWVYGALLVALNVVVAAKMFR